MGTESELFYHEMKSALEASVSNTDNTQTRSEAVSASAMLIFINGDTPEALEYVQKLSTWSDASGNIPEMQAAICRAVGLICSSLPSSVVMDTVTPL